MLRVTGDATPHFKRRPTTSPLDSSFVAAAWLTAPSYFSLLQLHRAAAASTPSLPDLPSATSFLTMTCDTQEHVSDQLNVINGQNPDNQVMARFGRCCAFPIPTCSWLDFNRCPDGRASLVIGGQFHRQGWSGSGVANPNVLEGPKNLGRHYFLF